MLIPQRLFQNPNVRFEIWDANGLFLYTGDNILDGICLHHDTGRETYSFRPINSGRFDFWCDSTEIVEVKSSSDK